jgi:hypothetical protein
VSVGQLAPPVLVGSVEEQRMQAENITYVPIRTVARVSMTRARLEELIGVLSTTLELYDGSRAGGQPT